MNSPDYKARYEGLSDQYLKLKALYTSQSIALDKAEQEIKRLEKALKRAAVVPEWQPIDYSQSESGKAPFDGDEYLLKMCDGYVGGAFVLGTWMEGICDAWYTVLGVIPKENVCEWMPVPEFMKG